MAIIGLFGQAFVAYTGCALTRFAFGGHHWLETSVQSSMSYSYLHLAKNDCPFVIRPAIANDDTAIERNISAICEEQEYLHTDTFVRTSEWEMILSKGVDLDRREILLVVEIKDVVIGHGRIFRPWFGPKGQHVADVGIAILKPWREIGIGTILVSSLLEWARRLDYQKASVEVISTNQRAVNLFRKFGFVEEGRRRNHLKINGTYRDEILMGLVLSQH